MRRALPNTPHWQVGVENESYGGASCPGPASRSFVINGDGSPVRLGWSHHNSDVGPNWSVNMVVDRTSPYIPGNCGSPSWTWFSFQDQPHPWTGEGELPTATTLATSHVISYSHWEATPNDATRLIAGAQFTWGGRDHVVEIDLTSANYNYAPTGSPGLLLRHSLPNGEFIILDGRYWGLYRQQYVDTLLYIPWANLVWEAVHRGWLQDYAGTVPRTTTVHLAVEVKDRALANLWHTNFRTAGTPP